MEEQERQQDETPPDPELLYHYTHQKGLFGILKDNCIWATHSQCLNDLSEYQIMFDALRKIVPEELKSAKNEDFADVVIALLSNHQKRGVFVSSFSEGLEGDSLSMWRAYSSNSGGYSIGFDRLALDTLAESFFPPHHRGMGILLKCKYLDPEATDIQSNLRNSISNMLRFQVSQIETLKDSKQNSPWNIQFSSTDNLVVDVARLAILAASVKHIGFKDENEWRIILADQDRSIFRTTEFRQGKSQLIPYVTFNWKKEDVPTLIRRIVVGPTPNKDDSVNAVKMLLEKLEIQIWSEDCLDGVEVVPSKIPYRNW